MEKLVAMAVAVLGVIAFVVALSALFAWPVQLLWNGCLVDAVTFAKPITFLQAWGISLLAAFLFKSTVSTSK